MADEHPFFSTARRPSVEGPFLLEEVQLANRNCGVLLEGLRYDVTPTGMHYLLNHFDVPYVAEREWQVEVTGAVTRSESISLDEIMLLPSRTVPVTLECAGNGRGTMSPRYPSMPWISEAVGTAEWTGTPLRHVLERVGVGKDVVDVAFIGADRGFDRGHEHAYGRSLSREVALSDDVLLVWAMNGAPLLPQHGFPLRLIVPGWYGMASVKWLTRIEALVAPFDGYQQVSGYHYRSEPDGPRTPITHMRVKSLLVPPGIPDWYTRRRLVEAGRVQLFGRAWSGGGVPIAKVEVGIDGTWHEAELDPAIGRFAWRGWRSVWNASVGEHELSCRATNALGEAQPLETPWDAGGFGNNVVHRVCVTVR
jgi:DMSO/TMAO reductase YedYZ molybdopterin-dependent catalytic subunit